MIQVTDVQVGDVIPWCGREVVVQATEPYRPDRWHPYHRPGRYLICEVAPGDVRRLHYWDHEVLEVASR